MRGDVEPIDGELIYRGYSIKELVANVEKEDRFGFEEIAYLLLTGRLPSSNALKGFSSYLAERRELPQGFVVDMILKAPSKNIMNKLGRSVLALYSYDDECENHSIENEMRIAIDLIAKLPVIMTNAYQVKKSHYENKKHDYASSDQGLQYGGNNSFSFAYGQEFYKGRSAAS